MNVVQKHPLGVDISEHNGTVDFEALKRNGVSFVIIRCGYGSNDSDQDDRQYRVNIAKVEAAKIPYGVYLYSYAHDSVQARSEAEHVIRLLNGRKPAYGVWYDVEENSQYHMGKEALVNMCLAFIRAIENRGYKCGIYSATSWWNTVLSDKRLSPYPKWVAEWGPTLNISEATIWQYTNGLQIEGRVFDANLLMKESEVKKVDYDEFKAYMERYTKEQAAKPAASWAKADIDYLMANGVVFGDDSGGVKPQATATRQEVFAMMARLLRKLI